MNKDDLLYKYFSNSLTLKETQTFNELLEQDAAFKAQFEFEKNLKSAIKETESRKLKARLKEVEQDLANPTIKPDKTRFNYQMFAVAASIVVLLGWFGYNTLFGLNYNRLYQDNYKTYPNTVYSITRGDANNSLERAAFVAYEAEDYKQAVATFKEIEQTNKASYISFYMGQTYLELENLEAAKTMFEKVIETEKDFVPEAHWYLALTYLKLKNKTQAKVQLNTLVNTHTYNKEKALEILDRLD